MLLLTFFIGLFINAIGYIPPGNINLSVAQLTVNKGIKQAWYFILAFSCVEVFFTFGMMRFARWMSSDVSLEFSVYHIEIGTLTDAFMILMFLIMGSITWLRRNRLPKPKEEVKRGSSVFYGILLGVLNPVQIPTWLFFGNYVIIHQWIRTDYLSLFIFSIGSGLGSAIALYGYAHFARYIQEKFTLSTRLINHAIAILLVVLALCLIVKQALIYA
jgi:threonine/homoserine/homoserine lactone efflux protein